MFIPLTKGSNKAICASYAATAAYGVAVVAAVRHYVPIWDGWAFYRECFMNAANTGDCSCYGHTAFLPTAVYGVVAYLFPYNFTAFALFNLALGLAAAYVLGRGMAAFFPPRPWLAHLGASLLVLNPVMLAQSIQPSLDYMLAVLMAFLVAAFLSGDLIVATLIGLLMTSTKDPGIMFYGVLLIGYMLVTLTGIWRAGGFQRVATFAMKHSYAALPLLAFILYSQFLGLHAGSFGRQSISLREVVEKLMVVFPNEDLLFAQAASLFVMNFNWLLTSGIVAAIAAMIWRPVWFIPEARSWLVVIGLALALGIFFHTRVLLWNNPRYVLPLFVLLLSAAILGLSRLAARKSGLATVAALSIVPLLVASHWYTIDPLSKRVFGTFRFGEHTMLASGGFRELPIHGRHHYIGRDQLVYNLQFMKFAELAEAAVRDFGLDAHYITGPNFTGWQDFQGYDPATLRRSMRPDARQIDFSTSNHSAPGSQDTGQGEFVYLEFPNVLNEGSLETFKSRYELAGERILASGEYWIRAYEFGAAKR
jgi:hypothetical protein